jgi:hypothetical protein
MRTTSEGQATYGNFPDESNCLKVLKKTSFEILQING